MPSILSGSILRTGGSGEFLALPDAMPQLPPTTSTTGFTLITNSKLQTRYASSLGNIEFNQSKMYSNLPTGTIRILATGTTSISTNTDSGTLVVTGGVGIGRNLRVKEDIVVNDITIGKGYEGYNNIVFRGTATYVGYETNNGQENIAIGYNVLEGISSAYASIGIGRYALSSGTRITNSIGIGDYALSRLGVYESVPVASITGITQANPAVVTAPDHNLVSGNNISITGVVGMTEISTQTYYVYVLSSSTFRLYTNIILSIPVNSTSYSGYISDGTVNRILLKDNNIAIGSGAGRNLIDGQQNFLFGNQIAKNLTTGSYNFFVGVGGQNFRKGNNNISINGSNIVDGVDNQINLGTVFYYNGVSLTTFQSNLHLGLGEPSTSTNSGAVVIAGGLGISENVNVGGITTSTDPASGALIVAGGVGIGESLNVGKSIKATGSGNITLSPSNYNVYIQPTGAGSITIQPAAEGSIDNMSIGANNEASGRFTTVGVTSTATSTSTTTGALVVSGGVGIQGDVYSRTGIADENYLLYTPRVFVSTSTPASPRIGDVWVDATNFAYLQYIKDGTSTFWLQVGAI
jgi:hypothetical protein